MKIDSKTAFFGILVLLVLGVVIYLITQLKANDKELKVLGKENKGTDPTTPSGNANTTIPPNPAAHIYKLADKFRLAFLGSAGNRCGEIRAVNHLTDIELDDFWDYYWYQYGLTPYQEMYNAWVWCPVSFDGIKLYDRFLKKHNNEQ
ncbi:hypothetical protein [Aureispira sp. CCB-E]|uniref:hypothetical protein n=1 Tax=Aureispira sp. CCB-E TaxID=3051121 RepID=UPI0028691FA7|nr:hypothetical protein [Aureispira sp. CCB-E]WMX17489.1 hypothetical protein QP953_13995 [Aureispira sp. CCB-E]